MGATTWRPPEEFDEYRVVRKLGAGAMGEVFLAHDTVLDRPVAVKFLSVGEISDLARERFFVEARALARLQHPNVVTVYRVGELGRRPFLVSEFIHGESLDRIAKPLPWRRACELAIGLARGLAAAHRRGVLHRDIKPANTILAAGDDEVKLLDFGLAKLVDADIGTPGLKRATTAIPTPRPGSLRRTAPVAAEPAPFDDAMASTVASKSDDVKKILDDETVAADSKSEDVKQIFDGETVAADSTAALQGGPPPAAAADSGNASPSLTRDGAVMGTPYYMPPEAWRGEQATPRSDIYSLGVLLYELVVGAPPHRHIAVPTLAVMVQVERAKLVAVAVPDIEPRFAAIVDRCLELEAADRWPSADALREALEALTKTQPAPVALPAGNPYRGLRTFEAEHRALFFGRDSEIRAVVERLRTDPFVLVAGDSGLGKSSLCRAGVVPAVMENALAGGRMWRTVTFVPGRRPAVALAAELARCCELDEPALERDLVAGNMVALENHRRTILRGLGAERGVLLVIDQLEEMVTIADPKEAAAVAELLAGLLASAGRGIRLLATVRGDFLTRVAALPSLGDEMPRALYVLRPMTTDSVRDAIVGPALAKGVRFESNAMVDDLVAAATQTSGSLPLLQFALAELWEARPSDTDTITAQALAGIGGLHGALARHADRVLGEMLAAERAAARRILLALISADRTRARHSRTELVDTDPVASSALEALVRGRLISVRENEGEPGYEVAHEALLTHWTTLRGWLDDDGERRVVRRRVEAAATEWERLGRTRDLLWSRRQLEEVARVDVTTVAPVAREFVDASHRTWRMRRLRRGLAIAALPVLVLASILIIRVRVDAGDRDRRAAAIAERDRKVSELTRAAATMQTEVDKEAAALASARREAFRQFDAIQLSEAEASWIDAQRLAAKVDAGQAHIGEQFEHALVIDPTRTDVRKQLADVLYARAELADTLHLTERRDELLRRLVLHDEDGALQRRWNAPAHLAIEAVPAATAVTLSRFIAEGNALRASTARSLGATPLPQVSVEPGSYLLELSAPGRVRVRYPVLLGRGENYKIAVELPPLEAIPEGFVYVPPGRFLVGSSQEALRREFLATVPLHEARTEGFMIAIHETTYADWIEYLKSLPPAERAHKPPKIAAGTIRGRIGLNEEGRRWRLTFQVTTQLYTARDGERIRFSERAHRAEQDWLRFPVSGVAADDVVAYAAWLHTTGRVPGARLCTDHEWERAARGADTREFPASMDHMLPDDANFDETYGKQPRAFGPDEVGSHPASQSVFGVHDTTGNIFEWVVSTLSPDPYAVKGGAFYFGQLTGRVTNRWLPERTLREITQGVRICASYPPR